MREVFTDFETFSYADLPEVGTYRYFDHPSTEPLCYAIALDDSPVSLCVPDFDGELSFPPDFDLTQTVFIAHHCDFERNLLKKKYGINIPIKNWRDTAAMAARMSLPRSLEELAVFFGLDVSAKVNANTAKKGDSVCRPRPPSKHNPATRWTPATKPEAFQALYARCALDVELCRAVYRKLLQLEDQERKIWILTHNMNERGVKIDLSSIPYAREVLAKEAAPLLVEFEKITGGLRPTQNEKLAAWFGNGTTSVDKVAVREALKIGAAVWEPDKLRAWEIKQILSKSSIAKLDAMERMANEDERVRGCFLYAGAERTLRYSSKGIQLQNMKRGLGEETDVAFRALQSGMLELLYDGAPRPHPDPPLTPTGAIAEMLRGFVLGPHDVADFAQIEARVLAWLAEDWDQVALFANHGDPYCVMASDIYKKTITKKDKAERFMGKQSELSCGYQVSGAKFAGTLYDTYDVSITDEFADYIVARYRERHPKITAKDTGLWDRLKNGFVHVIATKKERIRVTRNLYMGYVVIGGKPFAYIELPNGRKMYYAEPELKPGRYGPVPSYFGRDRFMPTWGRVTTYGGKLAENATQAYSREIMVEGMLRLENAGYEITMTVHDEVVTNSDQNRPLKRMKEILEWVPEHAKGLPIEVDAFQAMRYRK